MEKNSSKYNGQGIILYHHPNNFYSLKVLFALYEKNIKFTIQLVDITAGEQYSDWFLELNPKADVPVLRNGSIIVNESSRIIDYLENQFLEANIPKLIPTSDELDQTKIDRILLLHKKISRIPIGAISMGTLYHPFLCSVVKPPFTGLTKNSLMEIANKVQQILEDYALRNPIHAEVLVQRSNLQMKKRALIENRSEFLKLIEAVEKVLAEVELELSSIFKLNQKWLGYEQFSIADLSLTMILQRLYALGLENHLIEHKFPHIEMYYNRTSERIAFKNTFDLSLCLSPIIRASNEQVKPENDKNNEDSNGNYLILQNGNKNTTTETTTAITTATTTATTPATTATAPPTTIAENTKQNVGIREVLINKANSAWLKVTSTHIMSAAAAFSLVVLLFVTRS